MSRRWVSLAVAALLGNPLSARTVEIEATRFTEPGIAVSPDGTWIALTVLGHIFRVPAQGGNAEQLTFGPFFDADPSYSPDGSRIAFVSDRSGPDASLFVLDLESKKVSAATHETMAVRPVWTASGDAIVYLSLEP